MLPTKDELIETIAIKLDSLEDDSVGWQNRTELWKNTCRNKAEVILDALIDSLPEHHCDVCSVDIHIQLLGMRK